MVKKLKKIFKPKITYINYLQMASEKHIASCKKQDAYFHLGLYGLAIEEKCSSCKSQLMRLLSYVHLDEVENARRLMHEIDHKCIKKHSNFFIPKLLPYVDILDVDMSEYIDSKTPMMLRIATWSIQERENLGTKLLELYEKEFYLEEPEMLLFLSNLSEDYGLEYLNTYLGQYGLSPLDAKERNAPINVHNLIGSSQHLKDTLPLVSIIMTAHNSEKYIKSAIESILNQTYSNFELIIVDDSSQDSTVDIIKKYMEIDTRLRRIELKENIGTYMAKNIAIMQSNGTYITFHDSDDYSHPRKIELQMMPLLDQEYIASISYWVRLNEDGTYYSRQIYPFLRMNLSSLMCKKEVIEKIGFFDGVRSGADSEYFYRLLLVYGEDRIIKIKKPLSFGAHRVNSLMTSKEIGYSKSGISLMRQQYREAWSRWHMGKAQESQVPFIDFANYKSQFNTPREIQVDIDPKAIQWNIYEQ